MPIPQPPFNNPTCTPPANVSFDAVYARLKTLARRQLAHGARNTLDTTALVHELYLRLDGGSALAFEHPAQFFSYAARAMRHVLVDRARDRMRQKAGGGWIKVTFTANADAQPAIESAEQALALEEALTRLEETDPRAARVVELRYFAGLSPEQVATLLGVTRRTIDRDWRYARAFLHTALE
ncbi:MAG TPA: ECF-type sigma factor [Rhodanobacteraceae bacterium]|nr:ECF-type sigma factor [Rhodanobacteraceae bacterium]